MPSKLKKLYEYQDSPEQAYLLEKGSAYFYVTATDKYALSGEKMILGVSEYLLNNNKKEKNILRQETVACSTDSKILKISSEKIQEGLKNFSFQYNVCTILAKQVKATNEIINKNMQIFQGQQENFQKNCLTLYKLINYVKEEYSKRKYPWLKEVFAKYDTSLIYKRGEALAKANQDTLIETIEQLEEHKIKFPKESIICHENSTDSEMYILKSGSIDVLINERKITTITTPGTVIGEMCFLLKQPRTATLKAKQDSILTVISIKQLKDVIIKMPDLFIKIATSLAQKHYFNCQNIQNLTNMIVDKNVEKELKETDNQRDQIIAEKARNEVLTLISTLKKLVVEKDADFLNEKLAEFS